MWLVPGAAIMAVLWGAMTGIVTVVLAAAIIMNPSNRRTVTVESVEVVSFAALITFGFYCSHRWLKGVHQRMLADHIRAEQQSELERV